MEDLTIKAVFIGVSVLATMAVLSSIMLYFNTAQGVADTVSKRTDIASVYDSIMNEDNFETTLTGVEIRSLISKYAGNENVVINIVSISGNNTKNETKYRNVNNRWDWIDKANVISEAKLDLINPVWDCYVKKVKIGEKTQLEISLDVEK